MLSFVTCFHSALRGGTAAHGMYREFIDSRRPFGRRLFSCARSGPAHQHVRASPFVDATLRRPGWALLRVVDQLRFGRPGNSSAIAAETAEMRDRLFVKSRGLRCRQAKQPTGTQRTSGIHSLSSRLRLEISGRKARISRIGRFCGPSESLVPATSISRMR